MSNDSSQKVTLVQAVNLALHQAMQQDNNVVVLGQDVARSGGVFRATEGLLERFGKQRVLDTPLAESAIVGAALGMALNGLKPVAELQFCGFSYQAFHQIVEHVARYRNRTRGEYGLPMVIRMPCGGGVRAFEHHSESPETYYAHTPGLKVVLPSTPNDAYGLLLSAIEDPDPVIFLEPKKLYRSFKENLNLQAAAIPLGQAKILQSGNELSLISYGSMIPVAQEACQQLHDKFSIELIDLRTLSPLDSDTLLASVRKTGRALILHEAPRTLGMGSEIAAILTEGAFFSLKAPILRISGYDTPMPYYQWENEYLPSPARVIKAIETIMAY